MLADAAVLRLRATDAVEKITVTPPEYLLPYKAKLLAEVASSEQQEVRWHVAQLFSRPPWNARECRKIVKILEEYLRDRSSIVKTNAMQALADLVVQDRSLRLALRKKIERLTRTGSPAMQSRGRKLLKQLREL